VELHRITKNIIYDIKISDVHGNHDAKTKKET